MIESGSDCLHECTIHKLNTCRIDEIHDKKPSFISYYHAWTAVAKVYMVPHGAVKAFNDKDVEALMRKPVLIDGPAFKELIDKGYGWAFDVEITEKFNCLCRRGAAGWRLL